MKWGVWILFCLLLVAVAQAATITTSSGKVQEYTPQLSFTLFSQTPDPVAPGNYVDVRVGIENKGGGNAEDFEVRIIPEYPFSFEPGEEQVKSYGTVGAGVRDERKIIAKWTLRVDENAVEGDTPLTIQYRVKQQTHWTEVTNVELSVQTADAILHVPTISTVPEKVSPGDQFLLHLTLENQADTFFQNIRASLALPEAFVAVGTTDEQFLKYIGPGERNNITFSLVSRGDADQVVYNIPLELTFYDNENEKHERNASFGILLEEEPQLVAHVDQQEPLQKGKASTAVISVTNKGVEEIKFVWVHLLPDAHYDIVSPQDIYLGNIDSDDFENAQYLIVPKKGKQIPLQVKLDYQDGLNREYEQTLTLKSPVYSSRAAQKLGLVPQSNFLGSYFGFSIFVFAVAFWITQFLDFRKRKMSKERKYAWLALLLLTTIFGAILYYFLIKRRS